MGLDLDTLNSFPGDINAEPRLASPVWYQASFAPFEYSCFRPVIVDPTELWLDQEARANVGRDS